MNEISRGDDRKDSTKMSQQKSVFAAAIDKIVADCNDRLLWVPYSKDRLTKEAARVLIEADGGGGFSVEEVVAVLEDPDIEFTTTPANIIKYATFMHSIGSIDRLPHSWQELFFPEIHAAPGS